MTACSPARGQFITLEGGDGAGKSTSIPFIEAWLAARGVKVAVTREPGGTALGEALRGLLLGERQLAIDPDPELLLIFAARAQHLAEVVRPNLARGVWVLCDRFTDATYAYQGGGRGLDAERIEIIEQWVQGGLRPDLTLLFDVPVDESNRRIGNTSRDRFERADTDFKESVRQAYLSRQRREPARIRLIHAGCPLAAVQADIAVELDAFVTAHATH